MKKKGNLYFLIKSLTPSEKRYFKIVATSGSGNKNPIRLFDFIDKEESPSDESVKAFFEGEKFLKQLHVTKIYLHKLVMRSLRNFHHLSNKETELIQLLQDIEILFKKDLFDHCQLEIERGLKLARTYEKDHHLLALLAWKRQFLLSKQGPVKAKKELQKVFDEVSKSIARQENLYQYWQLIIEAFPPSKESRNVVDDELLRAEEQAHSLQAKTLFYYAKQSSSFINRDFSEAFRTANLLVELLEKHPKRIKEDPRSYITALNNLIGIGIQLKQTEDLPQHIEKIRLLSEKDKNSFSIKAMLHTYNIELELYRDLGEYDKGLALFEPAITFIKKNERHVAVDYKLLIYFQFAYLHFKKGLYSEALKCLNELIYDNFEGMRQDIQTYGRMLNLIIHFELGNIMVLKYAVASTRRFMQKKRKMEEFEKRLLSFFSKISTSPKSEYAQLFRKLQTDIFEGYTPAQKSNILDYLDFESWIEERV